MWIDVTSCEPPQVAAIATALRTAQPEWEAMGFAARARWLARMRDWLMDNEARLVESLQAEAGKERADAAMEVPWICEIINRYSRLGRGLLAPRRVKPGMPLLRVKDFEVMRRPFPRSASSARGTSRCCCRSAMRLPALLSGAARS